MSPSRARVLRRARGLLLALAAAVLIALVAAAIVLAGTAVTAVGLLVAGGGTLLGLLALVAVAGLLVRRTPRNCVLELDLVTPPAQEGRRPLARRTRPTLRDVVETLERAAGDARVSGLLARIGTPASGLADVQELQEAIERFREAGKFAIAHADTLGELSSGNGAYYLAASFDEIILQPSGDVGLLGVAAEITFLRDGLDRLGVAVEVERRWEHKTAAERFKERRLSAPARESIGRLVESQFEQLVEAVAERRGLSVERVRQLVDASPVLGPEAQEAGLVDALGYRDEAADRARGRAGGPLLPLPAYRSRRRRRRGDVVALIQCSGVMVRGRGRAFPPPGTVGAETLAAAIRRAAADRHVRALILRIDSPGGSYVAADTVWREIVRARERGTPVVASMGNVAASGGYFVAAAADRVVAHGGTVTGSIGVIGGKAVVRELKEKLGMATDAVQAGANALISSASRPWSEAQRELVRRALDRAYDDFTGKVARGRGLSPARMDEVARGRAWTGADAAERGLVDELGGYHAALAQVRELLALPADAPLRLTPFPPRRLALASLRGESELDALADAAIAGLGEAAALAAPLVAGSGEGPIALAEDLMPYRW